MATSNKFKIIKLKSKKMFEYKFGNTGLKELNDISKERIGFYHLVLENITGNDDITQVTNIVSEDKEDNGKEECLIIDSEYNSIIHNKKVDDLGIDAIHIKEKDGEVDISLFNFKYRVSFKAEQNQSETSVSRSTKFLEYIINNEKKLAANKNYPVNMKVNEIMDFLNSDKICNIKLYMVSNEANGLTPSSSDYIKILEDNYSMKVINISLDDIAGFFSEKRINYTSKFMISPDDFLSFQCDEKSTQKSYVLKLSLLDLIRIVSNNDNLSNNYKIENDEEILNASLDLSLLADNVRGYLGETKYNRNIIETLLTSPHNFFMYNNGITITAEKIECSQKNSGKKYLFEMGDFQIVNGGQTLRSVDNFLKKKYDDGIKNLRTAYVLVRVFKIDKDDDLQNRIAEYTNSQNVISDIDLKSVDKIQIELEKYFAELSILYVRKAGDVGSVKNNYERRIIMQKMAQILYSSYGYPDRASNQKKKLFMDYYREIFISDNFSLEKSADLVYLFKDIEDKYYMNYSNYSPSDQKFFYIVYIVECYKKSIDEAIEILENAIKTYETSSSIADARKLIKKNFKIYIDQKLS